jgi:inner membrane protein
LIIGANFPDVDALAYLGGPLADLEWRRGWTHGVLAVLVLPFLLTAALLLVARLRASHRGTSVSPVKPRELLLLSAIAVVSHPILDTLNTYGVRWLMPFSGQWFYGDVLFIVDPWLWLMLGGGLLWARMQRGGSAGRAAEPVRYGISLALVYIAAMWISSLAARAIVQREIATHFGGAPRAVMAGPRPLTPLIRTFVVRQGEQYRVGNFQWLRRPHVDLTRVVSYPLRRPAVHPAYAVAESTVVLRRFLGWARYPALSIEQAGPGQYLVHAVDLRYAREPGASFGALTVTVADPAGPRR